MRHYSIVLTLLATVAMSDLRAQAQSQTDSCYFTMPDAQAIYDFSGDGKKQVAVLKITDHNLEGAHTKQDLIIASTNSLEEGFIPSNTLIQKTFEDAGFSLGNRIVFIEDVNRDGKPEFSTDGLIAYEQTQGSITGTTQLWLSKGAEYSLVNEAFALTNLDLNNDGRLDYLILKNNNPSPYGEIAYQTPDGSFSFEKMEFVNRNPLQAPSRGVNSAANQISLPMTATDLNGDGLTDLVNERQGMLYINKGNGQWEWKSMGATVIPADFNGDGLTDFVLPSDNNLSVAIYNPATHDYVFSVLQSAAITDDIPFCYDFDKDGDTDILATFSAYNNYDVAYTCFFINDGQGHFTQQNEQNYGYDNPLWFSASQDLDGDGYYDLLAFRGEIKSFAQHLGFGMVANTMYYDPGAEIMWLRGGANNTFAAPQKLYELPFGTRLWGGTETSYIRNHFGIHINAEDLDGNGTMRVWVSGVEAAPFVTAPNNTTILYPVPAVSVNQRPATPTTPNVQYNNGYLTVTWSDGADDHTAASDLTYALRIGTTAGGNDILAAHANADGTRRNCLDGNMGKSHTYTIDLSSYPPSTVYVAVQTIDAQHSGSVWSEEATATHTRVPVGITLSRDKIGFKDSVEVHYTALPDGYTHSWSYEDGVLLSKEPFLVLRFPTGGNKTITHVVTMPGGEKDSASAVLTVVPADVDSVILLSDQNRNVLNRPIADYTYDGRMDGLYDKIYEGDSTEVFRQAIGMWNRLLNNGESLHYDTKPRWYDWDRDGHADLLYRTNQAYATMLHNATQPALTARVDDNNLAYLLGFWYEQGTRYNYFSLRNDLRHIGMEECVQNTVAANDKDVDTKMLNFNDDGSIAYEDFTIIGDVEHFNALMRSSDQTIFTKDFDHDGFGDITGVRKMNDYDFFTNGLPVFYNLGDGVYEEHNIPYPEPLPDDISAYLEDLNGDGYLDLIVVHSNYWDTQNDESYTFVLWNNYNQFFTKQLLPNSTKSTEYTCVFTDVDNNGYLDIVAGVPNPNMGDYMCGVYAWYMDADGLMSHDFLIPATKELYTDVSDVYLTPEEHYLFVDYEKLYSIIAPSDERPAAPANIQATMTNEGLLLTWDAAVDDHTPAVLMRYNLSMKMQGATTYLFSPQNGGNDQAMYIPGYNYINATRFLIPKSVLANGNYEIAIQAIDNQNKLSLFSPTLTVAVERNPIEVSSSGCTWRSESVSYHGGQTTDTPVWDFDGGIIESGSGFGPYSVYWTTGGKKVITLTLGEKVYTETITIEDPYELPVYVPTELYEGTPAAAQVPDGVTGKWYAKINDDDEWHAVDANGIYYLAGMVYYDKRLTADGLTITAQQISGSTSLCDERVQLRFVFTTRNGYQGQYDNVVTVKPATAIPTLTLVTTDSNGHNQISWSNAESFTTMKIYKEGATFNVFELIGVVQANEGSFADANSDATQKAERYRIAGVTNNGNESPASTIHKTVHLTVNRGVINGTYNLIWNEYAGSNIASYNILRGATPASLTQIATVSASNTSYTDQAPVDEEPYYAIEYVLSSASYAPAINSSQRSSLSGRSNVVNRNMTSGIETIEEAVKSEAATKVVIDGHIFILKGDKIYNLIGQEMK